MSPAEIKIKKTRAKQLLKKLKQLHPDAKMMLNYANHWELLVAVVLSAQCTDKQVNKVTASLFKKYPTLDDYVRAKPNQFEKDIYATGFFRSKTKHILSAANRVKNFFHGIVPNTMHDLLTLDGVGRKTAHIILGNAFGIVEGIAVDTHVKRFARVYGLSNESTPEKIEQDLMQIIPKKDWFHFTYLVIDYGRAHCPARKHKHELCPLARIVKTVEKPVAKTKNTL